MKLDDVVSKLVTVIVDHKDILIKSAIAVGVIAVSTKYKLPLNFGGIELGKTDSGEFDFRVASKSNAEEDGIISLASTINGMSFDRTKKEVAGKIKDIALKSTSEDTRKTAINCLEQISKKMDFSSSKDAISNYIYDIVMKGVKE